MLEDKTDEINRKPTLEEYLIPFVGTRMYVNRMHRKGLEPDIIYIPKIAFIHATITSGAFLTAIYLESLFK